MTKPITFSLDGRLVSAPAGTMILDAAEEAGVWIPRLCAMKGLTPWGGCRVCTVKVNGRYAAACTTPIGPGLVIENDTDELLQMRRDLIDMLFVEGNHFCMSCEKSGACELQALAYRFGIMAPHFPYQFPKREMDASHPDVLLDRDRCVMCARCVRSSRELDGKNELGFVGRGKNKSLAANAASGLKGTNIAATDAAVAACPTGSLLQKRVGFAVPIGERLYDHLPIGSAIEDQGESRKKGGA